VANTWYVDEAGNFVLMSESQRQAIELAQLPTPDVPLQTLSETAASSMQVPPEMLQQVMGWSAAMGGVAGGGLVGSLALSSGMLRGPEGPQGPAGPVGPPGDPASGGGLSAYEVAVNNGFVGSEQNWLNSLVGPTGATGADGNNHPSIFGGSAASVSVSENSTAIFYTASATDPDAGDTPTFTKGTAGGDEGLFTLTSDGKLSFTSAADFENPLSQVGGNTYSVEIIASDGRGGTDTQDVTVNVTDITENSTLELNETNGATFNILQGNTYLFDAFDSEGDTITYSLMSNGHGAGVTLNSQTGLLSVASNVAAGSADVRIRASSTNPDQTSETDTETYTINVQDITPPTLTITADDDTLTLNQSTTLDFDFSEDVTGFTSGDISLSGNGTLTNFNGSAASYTATYNAGGLAETDIVSVSVGAFTDLGGQINTAAFSESIAIGGLIQTYGDYFGAFQSTEILNGTSSKDLLNFGQSAAWDNGTITINGNGGDDEIYFAENAAQNIGSSIFINNGDGNQNYTFLSGAASSGGFIEINAGNGNHLFDFNMASALSISTLDGNVTLYLSTGAESDVDITLGDGDHLFDFGNITGYQGNIGILTGEGDVNLSANYGFLEGGNGTVNLGDGNHTLQFGSTAGAGLSILGGLNGSLALILGNGAHVVEFEENAGYNNGSVIISTGTGDQVFSFNYGAASGGVVVVNSSSGNDQLSFGNNAASSLGAITLNLSLGRDAVSFGAEAARNFGRLDDFGSIIIDLGSDTDADSVSFAGLVGNIFIQNYSITYDDKVDVVVPSTWSGTDDGTDIVFTQSDQTITFEGLGGAGGSTDPLEYFM